MFKCVAQSTLTKRTERFRSRHGWKRMSDRGDGNTQNFF